MINEIELQKYRHVQDIAKRTMKDVSSFVKAGVTEAEIAQKCEELMRQQGVSSFWYYGVPALVLVGERTTLSISGREYTPTDTKVKEHDLVTVDLNPEINGCWGDYARTFVIGADKETESGDVVLQEIAMFMGLLFEKTIHNYLILSARSSMTFEELYFEMNGLMDARGYENLDLHGNLGHSIAKRLEDRIYIERGNNTELGGVALFTFEPHVKRKDGHLGFKRENIYYFENGFLQLL